LWAALVTAGALAAHRAAVGSVLTRASRSALVEPRRARSLAGAASLAALAAGLAAVAIGPLRPLSAGLALVGGDLVLVARRGRLARRAARAVPDGVGRHSNGPAGALVLASVVAVYVLVLAPGVGSSDADLLAALAILGLPVLALTGTLPGLVVARLSLGQREAIMPALLLGAGAGGAAALLVTIAPEALVGLSDGRLGDYVPYLLLAAAFLGLAQVLLHHLVAAGRTFTAVAHLAIACLFQVAMAVTATGSDAAVAVNGLLGGSVVLFTGLAVATVVAAPFTVTVPAEEAGDGPRHVGLALGALVAGAVAVRLASGREFWLDEAATARAVDAPLSTMLELARGGDPHPPLHLVLTWLAQQVLGDGILALRLPSLVAGALLVPLLYVTGKELYDRRVGVVAAGIGAFAPPLVWFSLEARPPVLAAFLATLSVLAFLRALRRGRASDWVLFGLAGAALLWAHQLAWIHVGVLVGVAAFTVARRSDRRRWLAGWAGAVAVVAVAAVGLVAYRSGFGPPPALPP
ncbi:MAG: glycosyltransferase family 39 protein, partial [Acidimicrobiales bacterium]